RLRVDAGDRVDPKERRVLLVVPRVSDGPRDLVAPAKAETADLGEGDVHVPRPGQVAARAEEPVALGQDVQDARADGRGRELLLALLALTLAPALAVATALLTGGPPVAAGTIPSLRALGDHRRDAAALGLRLGVGRARTLIRWW